MKKVLALCLALLMVVGASATVFADFVTSPSGNKAPEVIDSERTITVTAYSDRANLPEEDRQKLDAAYNAVVNTEDLSTLNSGLKDLATQAGADSKDLAVSDLFDISTTDNTDGTFSIELKPETLNNFVCLLHYHNDAWTIVEGAQTTDEGTLRFSVSDLSPFAIVVNARDNTGATGDPIGILLPVFAILMVVSAVGIVIVWRKSKKSA